MNILILYWLKDVNKDSGWRPALHMQTQNKKNKKTVGAPGWSGVDFRCSQLRLWGVPLQPFGGHRSHKKKQCHYLQVLLAWNVGRPQMGELVSSNSCVDTCAVHTRHSPVLVHWECNSRILLDARTLRNGSGTVCSVIWKTPLPVFCVQQGRLGVRLVCSLLKLAESTRAKI